MISGEWAGFRRIGSLPPGTGPLLRSLKGIVGDPWASADPAITIAYATDARALADRIKVLFPEVLGIEYLVLVLWDRYALEAVRGMANVGLPDESVSAVRHRENGRRAPGIRYPVSGIRLPGVRTVHGLRRGGGLGQAALPLRSRVKKRMGALGP